MHYVIAFTTLSYSGNITLVLIGQHVNQLLLIL